jgi:hypothetical protein
MVGYPRSAAWLALRGRTDVDLLVQGCTARWRQRTASCFGSTRTQYEWSPPFGDSLEERSLACADIAALLLALGLIGRSGGWSGRHHFDPLPQSPSLWQGIGSASIRRPPGVHAYPTPSQPNASFGIFSDRSRPKPHFGFGSIATCGSSIPRRAIRCSWIQSRGCAPCISPS